MTTSITDSRAPLLSTQTVEGQVDYLGRRVVYIMEGADHQFADPHRVARGVFTGGIVVFSLLGKVPSWPISLKLGPVIGPICASANTITYFMLDYWAGRKTVTHIFYKRTNEEGFGDPSSCSAKVKATLALIGALALSISSQLPTILAVVKYNSSEWKIPSAVIKAVAGSILPLYSIHSSLLALQHLSTSFDRRLAAMKGGVVSRIREKLFLLEGELNLPTTEGEFEGRKVAYWSTILQKGQQTVVNKGREVARKIGMFLGFCSLGVLEYSLVRFTSESTKEEISEDVGIRAFFAVATTVATFYLACFSIVKTAGRGFALGYSSLSCRKQVSLAERLSPKLSRLMQVLTIVLDILGTGAPFKIWLDFYKDKRGEQIGFTSVICSALFLMVMMAMSDIASDITRWIISKNGSVSEKELVKLYNKIREVAESVEKSSSKGFVLFVLNLPEEVRGNFLRDYKLSYKELKSFAAKNSSASREDVGSV
ncbi:MAG: hypothetical protein S4CHLAM45_07800 [Chlamydiales bacterium]|nr:hypothetical protein [Chlamydiales bacterium]MCH9620010.1 hypothetical protein [Chlamydiales bacterium]MCH9622886.1 hypothetical protein [Chlamydiales bacterium]